MTVSRRHAEFRRDAGEFVVVDVGSLNGTYVNREPVDTAVLANGDEVQIGKFRLVFLTGPREPDAADPAAVQRAAPSTAARPATGPSGGGRGAAIRRVASSAPGTGQSQWRDTAAGRNRAGKSTAVGCRGWTQR